MPPEEIQLGLEYRLEGPTTTHPGRSRQQRHTGQGGRRTQGVARVAMPVEEGPEIGVVAEERIEDGLRGQGRRHGQVSTGQSLGQGQQVRHHTLMLGGEGMEAVSAPRAHAGAPEAGHHLVGNEQGPMASGDLGHACQPSLGVGDHPGRTLHPRLDDQTREWPGAGAGLIKHLLHAGHAFPLATPVRSGIGTLGSGSIERTPVAPGRGNRLGGKQQGRPGPVEQVDLPHADGSNRVAMIGTLHRHEARFANQPTAACVLGSQLECRLHRRGAIVRIEDFRKPRLTLRSPRQSHQLLGQFRRGSTGQTQG